MRRARCRGRPQALWLAQLAGHRRTRMAVHPSACRRRPGRRSPPRMAARSRWAVADSRRVAACLLRVAALAGGPTVLERVARIVQGAKAMLAVRRGRYAVAGRRTVPPRLLLSCAAACILALGRRQTRTCPRRSTRCSACPARELAQREPLGRLERMAPMAVLGASLLQLPGPPKLPLPPPLQRRQAIERWQGRAAALRMRWRICRPRRAVHAARGPLAQQRVRIAGCQGHEERRPRRVSAAHAQAHTRAPLRWPLLQRQHHPKPRDCAGATAAPRPSPPGTRQTDDHS